MGQQPVEADRDPEAGREVEREEERQLAPADPILPEQVHRVGRRQ
jgi:hypothetical protein